ncbi:NUDIX domain-containing protein [Alkalimonas collagenimarina]|uniref:NUDIX domain-containing protein n=1 Tax=Alkalimonas collagenimarina TaxID=400390 RepID=A0ABT9GZM0_9GAMM|nr:NUDIX domain-containing protein [Alkalimonas collagenimarina]MDP4536304.1 NUDIX domain-containing protein [Alkalimonas collagenimarina]
MRLLQQFHHITPTPNCRVEQRLVTRGIVLKDDRILLLFTERYNDFSLPGGGVDADESLHQALERELAEEAGARDIEILADFGIVEEYRPWYKNDCNVLFMRSYCYQCSMADELGAQQLEHYEQQNGMRPLWVPVAEAIQHNQQVMQHQTNSMGLSIVRETFLLQQIEQELLGQTVD